MQYDGLMRKTAGVLGLLFALSIHAASTPELVRDFLQSSDTPSHSRPEYLFSNGERAFFFADDGQGRELWTSDGTAEGTRLVAELTPGAGPDYVSEEPRFVASGDLVYFLHEDAFTGDVALWRTDGTPGGTFPILHQVWWNAPVAPFGERGAIVAMDELYVTDGQTTHSFPYEFYSGPMVNANGVVYGFAGGTLWRTDGTAAGTRRVFDFEGYVDEEQIVVHGGAVYLLVRGDSEAAEVWRSDGTTTVRVATLEESDEWPSLLAIDAGVFALVNSGATTHGMRIDANGASLAFAIPGYFRGFGVASRDFFAFATTDPPRLWRSDGTFAGTRAIVDDQPFYDSVVTRTHVIYDSPSGLYAHDGMSAQLLTERVSGNLEIAEAGGRFLFSAEDDEHGAELWVSDGRASGTALLKNIHPDNHSEGSLARRIGDAIFFRARSEANGLEPWVIDAGGLHVIDVRKGETSSHPRLFTEVNGRLLFVSNPVLYHPDGFSVTDGTALHSILLYDFTAQWQNDLASFPVAGDRAFLFGWGMGEEVWTTDGTYESTQRGTALPSVDGDYDPVAANGVVFFVADDALWRTDGTPSGTYALASNVQQIHATPSRVFFVAHGNAHGVELWVSDGTLAGTHVVKDIRPGRDDAFPYYYDDFGTVFQALGDGIVFAANDGVHGVEPWFSDGTETGTYLLRDVAPGEASSMLPRFDREGTASAGGFAYFVADDGVRGRELWRTDGVSTVLARDIAPGRASSSPIRMRAIGDGVYFSADDGVHGRELWWSSLAGTHLVADVAPGTAASQPHDMTERDGWIYFFAMTEETGDELWRVEAPRVRRRAVR